MSVETTLLNAVIAKRDFGILVRNGLADESAWCEHTEAFKFIRDYVNEFGETPSIETMIEESVKRRWPVEFEAVDVVESPETLCKRLHDRNDKLEIRRVLETAAKMYARSSSVELDEYLERELRKIRERRLARFGIEVVDWTKNTDDRLREYEERASGEHRKAIPLFWPQLDGAVGGFRRTNYVLVEAAMKVGKSWLGALAGRNANAAGYKILHCSVGDMPKDEVMARLDTIEFGISNRGIWTGELSDEEYEEYKQRLSALKASGRPNYIIRSDEDWPKGLTVKQLEADIEQFLPDVVIIDQFSLMNHGGSEHSHYAETSRRLRRLAKQRNVLLVVLSQATGEYVKRQDRQRDEEDGGVRELRPPKRGDYSLTIAVRQDCTHMIALDAMQWDDPVTKRRVGKGLVVVEISRTGGEGTSIDLEWNPNLGIIRPRQPYDDF